MLIDGDAALPALARLVAEESGFKVCSIYIERPGDILELLATEGLNPAAVGRTRLRVGEGIVGLSAATGRVMNLADAPHHPSFAFRPETGEEKFASMLAVPVRRSGRTVGVITVQDEAVCAFDQAVIDELEIIGLLVGEILEHAGAAVRAEEGVAATVPRVFSGVALTTGVATGPVVLRRRRSASGPLLAEDSTSELLRLHAAMERMQRGLDELHGRLPLGTADGEASREILDAYRLVASDAGWLRRVSDAVHDGLSANAAVQRVAAEVHDRMRRVTDPLLRERLADLEDMAGRLLDELGGAPAAASAQGAILIARRLGPAELLQWHEAGIAGVAIEEATPAGHAAILSRALGLPALGGIRGVVSAAEPGDHVILDAGGGDLFLRPEQELRQLYERMLATRVEEAPVGGPRLTSTHDGEPVHLMLNMGLALELDLLDRTGAEGVGLFRTEIAALARGSVPDIAEQTALYSRVLDAAGDRPVIFRTLDLGADKLLPGEEPAHEDNPAMGWRSLRLGLDRPAILRRQARALLTAARGRPLSIMFPMVATVAEFVAARGLLLMEAERICPAPAPLRIGAMLEVPALLFQLRDFLNLTDFVSVGSNDLAQFLFAADRGASELAGRYDFLSSPMLTLLEQVQREADAASVPLSLCGEAAGRPAEALALAAIGFRTLSMSAASLPSVRAALMQVDLARFRPVLGAMREAARSGESLREPIVTWAREHGIEM